MPLPLLRRKLDLPVGPHIEVPALAGGRGGAVPQEGPGEADVRSGQGRSVGQPLRRHWPSICYDVVDGVSQVRRIPVNDSSDCQIEP